MIGLLVGWVWVWGWEGNSYVRQLVKAAGLTERRGGGNEDGTPLHQRLLCV